MKRKWGIEMFLRKKGISKIVAITGLTFAMVSYQNCSSSFDSAKIGFSNQSSVGNGLKAVTLQWDRTTNNEDDTPASIKGYRLYIGTSSEDYSNEISENTVGDKTEYRVTGLNSGETYYFAVAAVSDDGVESGKSDEISYKAP